MTEGLLELGLLKPHALFGMKGFSPVANAAFWSLLLNTAAYILVSLNSRQGPLEVSQADLFVDIYKYRSGGGEYEVMRRKAKIQDIRILLNRFLGAQRAQASLDAYEKKNQVDLSRQPIAQAELINYAETHLAGAIGAASAKIIIGSIAKEDPISLEEMFKVLEQTQEIVQYSRALEKKSAELERTTLQLKQANEQLKELDRLKADFITTVTHELRTPITSIKALSKIMLDNRAMPEEQRAEFLAIVFSESERLTRLINQVLDLEKIQSGPEEVAFEYLDLAEVARQAFNGLRQLMEDKNISPSLAIEDAPLPLLGNFDQLTQVVINLLSNAIKFCDDEEGWVQLRCCQGSRNVILEVSDNGPGIAPRDQRLIFEKFTQISNQAKGKPQGSGLGLFITYTIVEQHQGKLSVESNPGAGATFRAVFPSPE